MNLIIWPLLCGGLYLTSLYSYLLFHIVTESFSIVIAFALFMISWNTRNMAKSNYVLFLGITFLFTGLIDFAHTLAFKGMGIFRGFDANLPTQLWIIARYMQSLSLLVAPWFIDRKLNPGAVIGFYLSATLILLAAAFSGTMFPDCFIEGRGLTPFKIVSEYIICFILVLSLILLLRCRESFDPRILRLLVWSILFTILSELFFTFYISVYGLSNLIGHYFKIFSFYLIYQAIIVTGLENPYRLLFFDLQKHREELQTIIDASPIMIFYKDREARFIRVNKTLAETTGWPREEIEGKKDSEIYPAQEANYWEDDKEVIASGKPKTGIIEPINTTSGRRWVQTDKIPYRDKEGHIIGIIGFAVDITERKQAEEEREKLLAEKELLLKEVHHRIKNNMTTMMSLLSLQAGNQKDPSVAAVLDTAGNRLQSMMVLYDKLYRSENPREMPASDYLMPLVNEIVKIFPTNTMVKTEINVGDFMLPVKFLSPLGIMMNELITNIMKYAFSNRNDGVITVSATKKDSHVTLIVADNGIGIPDTIDPESSIGFGLQLVCMLTQQIDGTIAIERGEGTKIVLGFDV
ncbi:MAG: hypothetical protein C0392_07160 [Syntrophus sp. (in: bacteria)]|nr:hypothetical protein [Syntrophus sp. (in: bacteria)]